ncbi:MAG: hypothetical protein SF052_15925 [Bacteroidia bacterium]|nr:hypothetical protein [Bacteroidia bacterium]
MNILLWPLGIFLGIYLTFRLFGRQIIQFGLKKLISRLAKDAEAQSFNYYKNYGEDAFHEQVFVDKEMKVTSPKHSAKKSISADDIAEDVDYEELR